jgi:hypothetical protein
VSAFNNRSSLFKKRVVQKNPTIDTNHNGKIPQRKILLRPLRLFAASQKFYEHGQIVVCGSLVPDPLQTLEPANLFTVYDCRFEDG